MIDLETRCGLEKGGFRILSSSQVYQTDICSWKYVDRHFGRSRSSQEEVHDGALRQGLSDF